MNDTWVIRGGTVLDGTGQPGRIADVLIKNGAIVCIAPDIRTDAPELDASGRLVTPGFIDAHRHIDAALLREPGYGQVELRQGITTVLCGNCGFSLYPCPVSRQNELFDFLSPIVGNLSGLRTYEALGDYLEAVAASRPAIHVGALVGNGTVRIGQNGYAGGKLAPETLRKAAEKIRQAQKAGAFGLSVGLMYAPENAYAPDELVTLARALDGGVLAAHIRGEGRSLVQSVAEVIDAARQSGARLQISHFKAAGKPVWGEPFEKAMALVDEAAASGVDVRCDAYPYTAGSTSLLTLLPPSWLENGVPALCERLEGTQARDALRRIMPFEQPDFDNIVAGNGWGSFVISSAASQENAWLLGKSVEEIAQASGKDPIDAICDLIVSERGAVGIVNHIISPENLRRVLTWDKTTLISDSVLPDGLPHPRYHGAFTRFISMVHREKLMPMPEAIRRMTGAAADRYEIRGRGYLKAGFAADVAVFDPARVTDTATYTDPVRLAEGFDFVLTDGVIAVKSDRYTGARHGGELRHEK